VMLRLKYLPDKQEMSVLDCFAGKGVVWREVEKKTDKKINVVGIDKRKIDKIYLRGDNRKFLSSIDLDDRGFSAINPARDVERCSRKPQIYKF